MTKCEHRASLIEIQKHKGMQRRYGNSVSPSVSQSADRALPALMMLKAGYPVYLESHQNFLYQLGNNTAWQQYWELYTTLLVEYTVNISSRWVNEIERKTDVHHQ